jgi:serine/threonine-protein kinase
MSRVFAATELGLSRQVVIKVLPPELAAGLSVDRFQREIQLAASLQHPHIVPLLSAGQAGDLLFYTMPLVEGESLRARLAREGELPVAEAVRVLRDVADALSYAHRHGVVHRDIKPDNVLLSDHHALVTDFGVAKALAESQPSPGLTATGLALGTPAYMAPEQAAADPHTDQRADIYALGVMGYEILAGEPPFTGRSAQSVAAAHLMQTPVPLAERRPSVPPALAALVMRCLEKRPADRWQSAADLLQAVEALTAPEGRTTAPSIAPQPRRGIPRPRSGAIVVLGAALLFAAALGWLMIQRSRQSAPLDADLIAVAPFDVPDTRLSLWREGLVDVLSRNLDGAGPVRSVAATTVIRRWSGRADRPSAAALGRSTGARVVVFGSLIGTGPDSARLAATALDVQENHPLADIELRDAANRMDRMADSLTVRLLRELGRTRRIEVFRTTSMGSTSLPALKAFLRGEQWFRRASWDSALASYDEAIALDSMFPLALWRSSQVLGWQHTAADSGSMARALRAGALNHRLAPRDSLLLTADSIRSALEATVPRVSWPMLRRVHAIALDLTRRYPDDAEAWYLLGEARYHWGSPVGSSPREALQAFDRAIHSDPSFAPSYIHAVELALWLEGPEAGHRYASGYLALGPTDASAGGIRLADRLMQGTPRPRDTERLVREASASALRDARLALSHATDSAESVVEVTRALAAAPDGDAPWLSRPDREVSLGMSLLYRGHVRQAVKILFQNSEAIPVTLVDAALLTPAVPDTTERMFRGWIAGGRLVVVPATLAWWEARRDSATIRAIVHRSDSIARSAPTEADRNIGRFTAQAAQAYLALIRHDTVTAIRGLEALPDSLCPLCYVQRLTLAHLLVARQEDRKAAELLDRWLIHLTTVPSDVLWTLERGRVAERLGERDKAIHAYQYVADVWRHADPELQPYVREARDGLSRLTSEPRQ